MKSDSIVPLLIFRVLCGPPLPSPVQGKATHEMLAQNDALVARAREVDLYSNLVTSGVPLTKERLAGLVEKGLDHVQVSIQSARPERADLIAGYAAHPHKINVMRWVKELGLPLTMNVVLHRANLDEINEPVCPDRETSREDVARGIEAKERGC